MARFWDITHTSKQALDSDIDSLVSLAGRLIFFRKMGGVAFGRLVDDTGTIQIAFNKREVNPTVFQNWVSNIKIGDIVGVKGKMWISSTGEKSCLVTEDFKVFQSSKHGWPDKHNGLAENEAKLRKRYLDCLIDSDVRNAMLMRNKVISFFRNELASNEFLEFDTPILNTMASGAQAKPFMTHHNDFDHDMFLRIAPETYLKRITAAGFHKVFEIGKNFRNEGSDPSHMQEFTSLEWYACFWDYKDNLDFFDSLFKKLIYKLFNSMEFTYDDVVLNFNDIQTVSYMELLTKYTTLTIDQLENLSGKELDQLFKEKVRPNLIQPVYVIDYPAKLSPMAARHDDDDRYVQQWQLVVNGWEIVKCYTELTDSDMQRTLLEEQMSERVSGDDEAMMLEEDFLEAMEYGMPPQSGVGVGIDRLIALLTNNTSLRDTVFFPLLLTR